MALDFFQPTVGLGPDSQSPGRSDGVDSGTAHGLERTG